MIKHKILQRDDNDYQYRDVERYNDGILSDDVTNYVIQERSGNPKGRRNKTFVVVGLVGWLFY